MKEGDKEKSRKRRAGLPSAVLPGVRLGVTSASRPGTLHGGARPEEKRRVAGARAAIDATRAPTIWRDAEPGPRSVRFARTSGVLWSTCWGRRVACLPSRRRSDGGGDRGEPHLAQVRARGFLR